MEWAEITVETDHSAMDLVSDAFYDLGAKGVVVDDPLVVNEYIESGVWDYTDLPVREDVSTVKITAYLPKDEELEGKLEQLGERLEEIGNETGAKSQEVRIGAIEDEDWAETWKKYFHVQRIGKRTVIRPSWEEYEAAPDDVVIELDPGQAFGTGTHPTTELVLRELEELPLEGKRVFDMGTGSGVLSILSAKLGAKEVVAADFDGVAVKVAEENVAKNNVGDKVSVVKSDLFGNVSGKADYIVANIIADIILRMMPLVPERLFPGGKFIAGGIIEDRLEDVLAGAKEYGLHVEKEERSKGWVMLVMHL